MPTIPLHPQLGNIVRRVVEWQPYGPSYDNKRDAVQLAGHLLIFKQGTRVKFWGGLFHVEVWEKDGYNCEQREHLD